MFLSNRAKSQIKFIEKPTIRYVGDSIYYELTHKYFYSYFAERYDSVLLDFNSKVPETIFQSATINAITKCGILKYTLDGRLLFSYEIKNGLIDGLGIVYNNLLESANGFPCRQATFKKNKLSGFDVWLDYKNGVAYKMIRYKGGKLKEEVYWK